MDYPVYLWDVESSGCDVSAEQDACFELAELVEGGGSFLLFLLAVDVHDVDVYVVEEV